MGALNWAAARSYSAGVVKRVAQAAGIVPFEQAAAEVSAAGAITIGKRQAEELAAGAVADFGAFYAARRPRPCPVGTGLLITAPLCAMPHWPPGSPARRSSIASSTRQPWWAGDAGAMLGLR